MAQAQGPYPYVPALPPLAGPAAKPQKSDPAARLPSRRYNVAVDAAAIAHDLGPVAIPKQQSTVPLQVGVNRRAGIPHSARGKVVRNGDGSELVVIALKSPGAVGLRLRFTDFALGPRDEVYVRGAAADTTVGGPFSGKGPWNDGEFWSPTVDGDTVVIEYHRHGEGKFVVAEVSHIYKHAAEESTGKEVLSCEVDASCSTGPKFAVGRIIFVSGGSSYVCTGTALNNSRRDRTPYFLTANHCISTQAEARSIETYWLYQTTSCYSNWLRGDWSRTTGGADLLATSETHDSTLVRLAAALPPGVGLAGWTAAHQGTSVSVFGLHHPGNGTPPSLESYLRRSEGRITGLDGWCLSGGYEVDWTSGTTEEGSSGSGLFLQGSDNYLVGVLSCGSFTGACAGSYDDYGKFADFFPQVRQFLFVDAAPGPAKADFNGDGHADFIWHNRATGERAMWFLRNGQYQSGQFLDAIDPEWRIAGTGDLNADGQADFVWENTRTGEHAVWFLRNGHYTSGFFIDTIATEWQLASSADFNADGHADFVWQNTRTGEHAIWFLRNGRYDSGFFFDTIPPEWEIGAAADFNADGHADFVWQNTATGEHAIWFLRDGRYQSGFFFDTIPPEWRIAGAADFNADGHADFAWQNILTGERVMWFLRNGGYSSGIHLQTIQPEWDLSVR